MANAKQEFLRAFTGAKKPGQQQAADGDTGTGADSSAAGAGAGGAATGAAKGGFFGGLMDNPLFSAGAGIALLGAAATALRSSGKQVLGLARKQLTSSMEVTSKDHAYDWVLQWISARAGAKATHLGVATRFARHTSGAIDTHFDFVPGPGRHWLWYGGRVITVHRERDPSVIDLKSGAPWESVRLTTVGRSRHVFTQLLADARAMALAKEEGHTLVYTMGHITATHEARWQQFGQPRKRRPLSSVVLADGQKERIVADLRDFTAAQKWYLDRGIPYRRGYLLYGPPGCGKTSFIAALAGELQYNICLLNLNERGLTDDKLALMLANAPPRSIILLEDVDAAFVKRDPKFSYNVTFSGLLNTLDGVASSEERIIFMTTNHIEKLDPALIRPGRVDLKEEITYATPNQIRQMFLRFYADAPELATKFAERMGSTQLSVAALQGFFMHFKGDAAAAVERSSELLDDVQRMNAHAAEQQLMAAQLHTLQNAEIARQIESNARILSGKTVVPPKPPSPQAQAQAAAQAEALAKRPVSTAAKL